ncbi:MAG: hypothetical protein ACE5FL_04580 [Myxococcota bacterium]
MIARILVPFGLAALVIVNILCHAPHIVDQYITADSLYTAAMYRDLFVDGYDIRSWNLTPAPSLFPDVLLAFPLFAAAPHLGIAYIAYAAVVLLAIALGVALVAHPLLGDRTAAWMSALASVLFLSSLFRYSPYELAAQPLFSMSHHEGAYIVGLVLTALFLRAADRGYTASIGAAFLALAVPMVLSDLFVTTWFLLPIAIASVGGAALRWIPPRTAGITCLLIAAAHLGANSLGSRLASRGVFRWLDPVGWDSPGHMAGRLIDASLAGDIFDVLSGMPVLVLAVLVLAAATGWLVARQLRNPAPFSRDARLLLLLATITFLCMAGAVASAMAIGRTPVYSVRYLQPVTLLPASILAIFVAATFAKPIQRLLLGGVVLFSLATIAITGSDFDTDAFARPYPELARCLDELAGDRGLDTGYAGYWASKPVTLFSRTHVRANAVWKDVAALHMCNNDAWLSRRPGAPSDVFPRYGFVVTRRDPPPIGWLSEPVTEEIRALFGPEASRHACDEREVLIYDRPEDVAFRNRLRISSLFGPVAAVRRIERRGASKTTAALPTLNDPPHMSQVVCADGHAIWTRDGAGRGTAGISAIPGGRAHVLRFDPDRRVEVAEVAARGDHSYTLRFFLGDASQGSVAIPAVVAPMLRARYLAIPAAARERGFDRVELTPAQPGTSHVGHICFYPDA